LEMGRWGAVGDRGVEREGEVSLGVEREGRRGMEDLGGRRCSVQES